MAIMSYLKAKTKPLGSGARFAAIEAQAKKSGAKNPAAIAASIGIKKYGQPKMTTMAISAKKKKK